MCLAVPGRLLERHAAGEDALALGTVDFGGARRAVCLACVPEAQAGDLLLVHAGVAIAVVDEAAGARAALALDETLGGGLPSAEAPPAGRAEDPDAG